MVWAFHEFFWQKLTSSGSEALVKRIEILMNGEEPVTNWEELASLALSPHGRLQLRARGLLQSVLDPLKTTDTVEKALGPQTRN